MGESQVEGTGVGTFLPSLGTLACCQRWQFIQEQFLKVF